jgi:hypothetical protein
LENRALADFVIDVCFTVISRAKEGHSVLEALLRILECSDVGVEPIEAAEIASRRIERLAAQMNNQTLLSALVHCNDDLISISPVLASKTGRARALARLGRGMTKANSAGVAA